MENINWEFLVQTGILICLVILVYRSFSVEDSMHAHFDEVHEDADIVIKELDRIESNTK